jgi:hypothetical protein
VARVKKVEAAARGHDGAAASANPAITSAAPPALGHHRLDGAPEGRRAAGPDERRRCLNGKPDGF